MLEQSKKQNLSLRPGLKLCSVCKLTSDTKDRLMGKHRRKGKLVKDACNPEVRKFIQFYTTNLNPGRLLPYFSQRSST